MTILPDRLLRHAPACLAALSIPILIYLLICAVGIARLFRAEGALGAWAIHLERGRAAAKEGRGEVAERELQTAVREVRRLGISDGRAAECVQELGLFYLVHRRFAEAFPQYAELVRLREQVDGVDPDDLGSALKTLGVLHHRLGRPDEAVVAFVRSRALLEQTRGLDAESVLDLLEFASDAQNDRRQYEEASALLEVKRTRLEALRGPKDPEVLRVCRLLAVRSVAAGRTDAAERLYRRLIAAGEGSGAGDARELAGTLRSLANLCAQTERLDEAAAAYARHRELLGRALGARHPEVAWVDLELGGIQDRLGRPDDAERSFQEAIEIAGSAGPEQWELLAEALGRAGIRVFRQGRTAEVESILQRADPLLEAFLSRTRDFPPGTIFTLGGICGMRGKHELAETLYRRHLQLIEADPAASGHRLLLNLQVLEKLCRNRGADAEAEEFAARARRVQEPGGGK